jgi:hypothetical protein
MDWTYLAQDRDHGNEALASQEEFRSMELV